MAKITLIPEIEEQRVASKRAMRVLIFGVVLVLIVLAIWGGMWFYNSSIQKQITGAKDEISATEEKLKAMGEQVEKLINFEKRLTVFKDVINKHLGWSKTLEDTAKLFTSGTQLDSLSGDASTGKAVLKGTAISYQDLARLMVSLQNNPFEKNETPYDLVNLDKAAIGEKGQIGFDLNLLFKKEILTLKELPEKLNAPATTSENLLPEAGEVVPAGTAPVPVTTIPATTTPATAPTGLPIIP